AAAPQGRYAGGRNGWKARRKVVSEGATHFIPAIPAFEPSSLPAMPRSLIIPRDQDNVILTVDGKEVRLTNLPKIFWPELGLTKGDLLQYYADVAGVLLPHIRSRAMVMKRYP